jgi:histidine triad (HIT) family protein
MVCLFCDLVSGRRKKNVNGYPFIPIHQTQHTLSFLSIDFPAHEDGHLLIIPKKHFEYIEEVPKYILHDLIEHISLASKVTRRYHNGCNILINNGKYAGQYISHVHFHVIPRDPGDNITIESWEQKEISKGKFRNLSYKLKEEFSKS